MISSHFSKRVRSRTALVATVLAALAAVVAAEPASGEPSERLPAPAATEAPTPIQVGEGPAEQSGSALTVVDPPFNGLDESISGARLANTSVAASSTTVLQAVVGQARMTDTSGNITQTISLAQFFAANPALGSVTQPKVYFDRNAVSPRFYMVAIQNANTENADPADDVSTIFLAISRSSNPTAFNQSNWCGYTMNGLHEHTITKKLYFANFPGLGVGADGLVITTNHFDLVNDKPAFAVAVARPLDKLFYSNNAVSCPLQNFYPMQASSVLNDQGAATLQPAQHYTSPSSFPGKANPVYLVSARPNASSTYVVWRIANIAPFNPAAAPLFEKVSVSWSTYSPPPMAPGGAGGTPIDTGNSFILQTAGVGDAVTAVHTIACQFTANTAFESCFRTVRFIVGDFNGTMTVTKSDLQGLGGGDNAFYHHPGIAVNDNHQTMVVFLANMPNAHHVSSKVAIKPLGGNFGVSMPLTNGTCARAPEAGKPTVRTGEFSGAQTAVDGNAFWVAAEHADLNGATCQWKTRVAHVTP